MKRPKIGRLAGLWQALALTFLLGACAAPGFRAEVTRFHEIDVPRGERILIEPAAGLEAGLEFQNYAAQLSQYFSSYGYLPGPDGAPQLRATFGYFAEADPNYYVPSGPSLGIGFGGGGRHVGVGASTIVDFSDDDEIYFRHTITLVISEAGSGKRIYEGSASGHTRGEYMPGMIPKLLGALFINWPGPSGTTEIIKLPEN